MPRRVTGYKRKHPRWEFLTRTIAPEDLSFIKSLGGLYPSLKNRYRIPAVYTQYLSSELIPEQLYANWNYIDDPCSRITLIIHPNALKDFDFIACGAPMFGLCIKPTTDSSWTIMSSKKSGKSTKKKVPDMSKLVDYINNLLDLNNLETASKKKEFFNDIIKSGNPDATITAEDVKHRLYMLTHEILFTSIPTKYIAGVFTCDEFSVPAIKSYLPKTPVFVLEPPTSDTEFYYRDYIAPILQELYDELH
jgi:hypothetical protein